jgi:hypothetical protein
MVEALKMRMEKMVTSSQKSSECVTWQLDKKSNRVNQTLSFVYQEFILYRTTVLKCLKHFHGPFTIPPKLSFCKKLLQEHMKSTETSCRHLSRYY